VYLLDHYFKSTSIYVDNEGVKFWLGANADDLHELGLISGLVNEAEHRTEGPAIVAPQPNISYSRIWWVDGEPVGPHSF